MKTIEYKTRDKTGWGDGPWMNEPDKVQYTDEETGMPCLIVRGPGGALCGYVGVGKTHPYFKKDYDSIDVEVHGGLTFASLCAEHGEEESSICHLVEENEDDLVWWFGFDCAHYRDLSPAYAMLTRKSMSFEGIYRDISYVKKQNKGLAAQLIEVKS